MIHSLTTNNLSAETDVISSFICSESHDCVYRVRSDYNHHPVFSVPYDSHVGVNINTVGSSGSVSPSKLIVISVPPLQVFFSSLVSSKALLSWRSQFVGRNDKRIRDFMKYFTRNLILNHEDCSSESKIERVQPASAIPWKFMFPF